MITFIEQYLTREIVSSSLLLLVDNTSMKYNIKWIDFGRISDLPENKVEDNLLYGFYKFREVLKELPFTD